MQKLLESLQDKIKAFLKCHDDIESMRVQLQQIKLVETYLEGALSDPAHDIHTLRVRYLS